MQELEAKADAALDTCDITAFMNVVEQAKRQATTLGDGFAKRTAARLKASWAELSRWANRIGRGLLQGDEDELRLALERRSQLELAKDLYRETEVMETLDFLWDPAESDNELRERADQVGLYGCDYLPASHRWWKGFMPALGKPARDEPSPSIVEPPPLPPPLRSKHVATWVAIAGGRYQLGLTAAQARMLARALADATLRWTELNPDATLRDSDKAERMGGNADWLEPRLTAAFPAYEVGLPSFSISATPITNGEYAAFISSTGASPPSTWKNGKPIASLDHPVIGVAWFEAEAFAKWVGARLPSEEEWEVVARNGGTSLFPWGDTIDDRLAWMFGQPFYEGWRVGSRPDLANAVGVHDLLTGRSEWTASTLASPTAATIAALQVFYAGLNVAGRIRRACPGSGSPPCSVSRCPNTPSWQADGSGFRLVRRQ